MNKKIIFFCGVIIILIIACIVIFTAKFKEKNIPINEALLNENITISSTLSNENISINNIEVHQEDITKDIVKIQRTTDKVKMTIKNDTLTNKGATIIIQDNNEYCYVYDEWFKIERKREDKWEELEKINFSYTVVGLAYVPKENEIFEQNIKWNMLYGELENGEYRLVKKVYDNDIEKFFFIEFVIDN